MARLADSPDNPAIQAQIANIEGQLRAMVEGTAAKAAQEIRSMRAV
jgi:hypothetical protein